jgi:hypothetical protein
MNICIYDVQMKCVFMCFNILYPLSDLSGKIDNIDTVARTT